MKRTLLVILSTIYILGAAAQANTQATQNSKDATQTAQTDSINWDDIFDQLELEEVKVVGQKALVKLEVDRKSYDVSNLIGASGQAASDILDNIPSVEVDNDGNISLRGSTSVEVWINGKPSGLTSDNRATILEQMPAETIERIEVIDNPSAKFSAEGSAGIINIVLKKDRTAGYYGSLQAGATTNGGANAAANINYNSPVVDLFATLGYRHRTNNGHTESQQENYTEGIADSYMNYSSDERSWGNSLFSRAGVTVHLTKRDDLSATGMLMHGGNENRSTTPYYYGSYAADGTTYDDYTLSRVTTSSGTMTMLHGELAYTHEFAEKHRLDASFSADKWTNNHDNYYSDTYDYSELSTPTTSYSTLQYRPQEINNHSYEAKIDYENQMSERFKLETGYSWNASHENTPQWGYEDGERNYYNRFIYNLNVHAAYITATYKFGLFSLMGGLRGEYWRVNTESYDWEQEYGSATKDEPFNRDYFKLFPSIFASYQLTPNDQLQLNATRRLRRPWGGQLNSFKDTRDASAVSFGNPELTPEYSTSISANYLRTWDNHSMLLSLYYRPTSDVMQQIRYRDTDEDLMYSTTMNVSSSQSSGVELTVKNRLWRILDLTSNVNAYYYHLDAFSYTINEQEVTGDAQDRFSWNARVQASIILPSEISVQVSGTYRSRQTITQGYRPASYFMDFGARKQFCNKRFSVSVNCRDLLNSRGWRSVTESDSYWRFQEHRRNSRHADITLTWNFGNMNKKSKQRSHETDNNYLDNYDGDNES